MPAPALRLAFALVLAASGILACGGEKPSAPAPVARAPERAPAAVPQPEAPAAAAPADPSTAGTVAERSADVPAVPEKPAQAAGPVAKTPSAATPPGPTKPPATKPPAVPAATAHAKVGADKCKLCHRLQHQSWAESAHAKKALDCEGCHGNGGDYWPASVMRDRAKAVAAGLVVQSVDRCKKCHPKADAALLPKAHAHKAR